MNRPNHRRGASRRHNISPSGHDGWADTGWAGTGRHGDVIAPSVCTGADLGTVPDSLFGPVSTQRWNRVESDSDAVGELVADVRRRAPSLSEGSAT